MLAAGAKPGFLDPLRAWPSTTCDPRCGGPGGISRVTAGPLGLLLSPGSHSQDLRPLRPASGRGAFGTPLCWGHAPLPRAATCRARPGPGAGCASAHAGRGPARTTPAPRWGTQQRNTRTCPAGCLRLAVEEMGRERAEAALAGWRGAQRQKAQISCLSPGLALTCRHPWDIPSDNNVFDMLTTGPQCQGRAAPEKDQPRGQRAELWVSPASRRGPKAELETEASHMPARSSITLA